MKQGGRGGYEYFPEDGNHLFTIAQWYPRLCVYSDFQGWQNHQFTGRGEFALTFGNFKVQMTVPADHVVGIYRRMPELCTGAYACTTGTLAKSTNCKRTVEIVTLEEAKAAEKQKSNAKENLDIQSR